MENERILRQRFSQLLLAAKPTSVLDVGCGNGAFLQSLVGLVPRLAGIEKKPPPAHAHAGIAITVGDAASLPFADGEFDSVISQYTAHHLVDAVAATREALRVARVGVMILDVWYDENLPAGATMRRYDRWSKRIDEDNGEIHRPVLALDAIVGEAPQNLTTGGVRLAVEYLQIADTTPNETVHRDAKHQLSRSREPTRDESEWEKIAARGRTSGFSVEGAIIVTLLHH